MVGWLQLADIVSKKHAFKRELESELDENTRQCEQIAEQIRAMAQKQQELQNRNLHLQQQMKRMEDIGNLAAESQSIGILCKKEAASLNKVQLKMQNEYFMEEFDAEDVSTVFSMFGMDDLFARFRKNETDNNLEVTMITPTSELQNNMQLAFAEAVEMQWKLKLLENREKGVERHLEKCSICRSTKIGLILREYGMPEAVSKELEAKTGNWKGYFLATVNAASAALALGLVAGQKAKLAACLLKIQKAHNWVLPDD